MGDVVYHGKRLKVLWRPHISWFKIIDESGHLVKYFPYGWFVSVKRAKRKAIDYVKKIEHDAIN